MPILDFLFRLGAALLMGTCVGLERQWRQRMAGTRTNALVAAGAAAFVMCGFMVRDNSRGEAQIVSYVVSGIGFLGAGSILLRGEIVRGLTTAASLWSVAAIGLAVGGGLYTASIAATIIILIILAGIKPLERRFITVKQRRQLTLLVTRGSLSFHTLHETLGASSARVKQFVVQQTDDSADLDEVQITLARVSSIEYQAICAQLRGLEQVREFKEEGAG
jgi:putative Mg2+ transporter-C (MgtC) family protein